MTRGTVFHIRLRSTLLYDAAMAIALGAVGMAGVSHAQESDASPVRGNGDGAQADTAPDGDIVVTGTRVVRDGYKAPTPTSVLGIEEIENKAPANLADFVNQIPSISGSTTPRANVASIGAGQIGINALNLRNLGANRTLILLDGQRVAASNLTGLVDINTIPQGLVKRVDVVTGGASAEWGSDAVAGVVNFVLDKDFTGLKGTVQGGVTTYGDDRNYNITLTGGAKFADGRGHILISGEIAHNDGITSIGDRTWYNRSKLFINPAYTASNGQPQLLNLPNAGLATATPGGLITSGPLRGTYFGPGGVPTQFNYGSIVSGNVMVGGDSAYSDFGLTQDLDPKMGRQGIFARISYELTDNIQVYGQASYNRATARVTSAYQFNLGNITIQPDNAFIPASIASNVTSAFTLGTTNQDLGPVVSDTRRSSQRYVLGFNGHVDALGTNWSWDIYGQRSINQIYTGVVSSITSRYNAAIDAVRNPATGAIVCRSTLTDPTNGCVPYNVFGTGVASQAARNYVLGTSWGRTTLTENVYAATLRGDPFSTWAGPVSIATGVEHRREAVSGTSDPLSLTRSYFAGNYLPSFGSYHVTEGFLEAVVPLAKDTAFAKSLIFNGAIRATDYSTSGYVTTWKAGLTYSPVSDVTFRGSRSRDIRAPNLSELFAAGITNTTTVVDPFRNNTSSSVFQVQQGNLALEPEKADAWGLGVVFTPGFIPGFSASVDYYSVKIKGAISAVNAPSLVNQCYQGNSAFCSQIVRSATGTAINGLTPIGTVTVLPVNVATQISSGLDFEASYRHELFGGTVSIRGLATRFLKNYSNDGITPATDTVGTNGTNGTLRNSLPKWRYLATIGYDLNPISMSFTARGISAGVYNTAYVECSSGCPASTTANMTINNNRLPGATYFDANFSVKLPANMEAFFVVENLTDKDPVQMAFGTALGSAPLSINPLLYDVLGRTFRAGFRFKM